MVLKQNCRKHSPLHIFLVMLYSPIAGSYKPPGIGKPAASTKWSFSIFATLSSSVSSGVKMLKRKFVRSRWHRFCVILNGYTHLYWKQGKKLCEKLIPNQMHVYQQLIVGSHEIPILFSVIHMSSQLTTLFHLQNFLLSQLPTNWREKLNFEQDNKLCIYRFNSTITSTNTISSILCTIQCSFNVIIIDAKFYVSI